MARKKINVPLSPAQVMGLSETPRPPLEQQSRYSGDPWRAGQIPADPMIFVSLRHNQPRTPYGHGAMGVELPSDVGECYPLKMDQESDSGAPPWKEGKDQMYNGKSAIKSKR